MTRAERTELAALLDRDDVHEFVTAAVMDAHEKADTDEPTTGVVDELIAALRGAA